MFDFIIKHKFSYKVFGSIIFLWGIVGLTNGILEHSGLNAFKAIITISAGVYLYVYGSRIALHYYSLEKS